MKISPISYAIHAEADSRVFGDGVTVVTVDDDASGEYLHITQIDADGDGIKLTYEELMLVVEIANLFGIKK